MRVLLLLLAALPSFAAKWEVSVAFLAGTQAMDIASSRGRMETNPILGYGPFGARQVAIKGSIFAAVVVGEWLILRRHLEMRRAFVWGNYIAGGVTAGVAVRNWRH